jgi:hypothetical protein
VGCAEARAAAVVARAVAMAVVERTEARARTAEWMNKQPKKKAL